MVIRYAIRLCFKYAKVGRETCRSSIIEAALKGPSDRVRMRERLSNFNSVTFPAEPSLLPGADQLKRRLLVRDISTRFEQERMK